MAKFDLKEALKNIKSDKQKAEPRPCSKCGEQDAGGPCYGYDCSTHDGPDFDCSAEIPQECDTCFYIWCDECKVGLIKEILPNYDVAPHAGREI
jgi:hypothetical protein